MFTKRTDTKPKRQGTRGAWPCAGEEPTITEMMADPIVHLVMQRDGVTADEVWRVVAAARHILQTTRPASRTGATQAGSYADRPTRGIVIRTGAGGYRPGERRFIERAFLE